MAEQVSFLFLCLLPFLWLSTYLPTYPCNKLPTYLSIYLSVCLSIWSIWSSKSGLSMVFYNILTWKCASRQNGVYFFGLWTSNSGQNTHRMFLTFWLGKMRRATAMALFRHPNLHVGFLPWLHDSNETWWVMFWHKVVLTWEKYKENTTKMHAANGSIPSVNPILRTFLLMNELDSDSCPKPNGRSTNYQDKSR